eukprot:9480181-Pyramimonas_sp.AAC.1
MRALRPQRSARHRRPHGHLHIFSRYTKASRHTAHCANDIYETTGASVVGRVRPWRCSAVSDAPHGDGGGPSRAADLRVDLT